MDLVSWLNLVWYLNIAATLFFLGHLLGQQLHRSYPWLLAYFLADLAQDLVALFLARNSLPYFYMYLGGQALKLTLAAFVVLELYHFALAGHAALSKFGRRAVGYVMLFLTGIAVASLYFGPPLPPRRGPALHYFLSFERTMDTVLAVFLMMISLFVLWFPLSIPRAVAVNIGGFVAYFLSRAAALLAVNSWPSHTRSINVVALSSSSVCLIAWVALLRRGETTGEVVTGLRWNSKYMERLTRGLDAINTRLMRIQ